jgi:hypothetical protein
MQNSDDQPSVEHDAAREPEAAEDRAERTPVVRMLANPRRTRRA